MAEIMEVLSELGEFEWASRRPALKTSVSDLAYPPIIVWRYKRPSSDGAARIARAVQSFNGSIAWEFSAARKNWGIMPSRLGEYTRANGLHGELEAARELMAKEPEFGRRANAELDRLADHIHTQLKVLAA